MPVTLRDTKPAPPTAHADTAAEPAPGSLAESIGRVRRIADRIGRAVSTATNWLRHRYAPEIEGFHRHGWSGKLYLITHSAMLALSVTTVLGFAIVGTVSAATAGEVVLLLAGAGLSLGLSYVAWRVLKGVAHFSRRAWKVLMLFLGLAVLGGVLGLFSSPTGQGTVIAAVELALVAQFVVYFVATRDRFLPGGAAEALEPAEPSESPPDPRR